MHNVTVSRDLLVSYKWAPFSFPPLQAYNIHVNGVLHCRVRYSQLLGLHEQVGLPSKHSVCLCARVWHSKPPQWHHIHPAWPFLHLCAVGSIHWPSTPFELWAQWLKFFCPRPQEFKTLHVNRAAFWKSSKGAVDRMEGMFSPFLSFHLPRKKYTAESAELLRLKAVFGHRLGKAAHTIASESCCLAVSAFHASLFICCVVLKKKGFYLFFSTDYLFIFKKNFFSFFCKSKIYPLVRMWNPYNCIMLQKRPVSHIFMHQ